MIKVKINDILKEKERNISWLARKANIPYNTMYKFVMNKTVAVSYNVLEAVCIALECDIEDVIEVIKE